LSTEVDIMFTMVGLSLNEVRHWHSLENTTNAVFFILFVTENDLPLCSRHICKKYLKFI